MDAAEHPEDQTKDESHGHGQQRGEQTVKRELHQLEHGVASYPHPVEAVCGEGLRDDIFETDLSHHSKTEKAENEQGAARRDATRAQEGARAKMMDRGAGSDFQVFTPQISRRALRYMETMKSAWL